MNQKKLNENKTSDEKIDEILLKGIDEQLQSCVHQKEVLENGIKEVNMRLDQLNFQRRNLIKKGWRKI